MIERTAALHEIAGVLLGVKIGLIKERGFPGERSTARVTKQKAPHSGHALIVTGTRRVAVCAARVAVELGA